MFERNFYSPKFKDKMKKYFIWQGHDSRITQLCVIDLISWFLKIERVFYSCMLKKKTMYVLFVCRTTFPNAGTKCACLDWWFINSRFSFVKPRTFTSLEGGGVLRSTGIWLNLSEKKKRGRVVMQDFFSSCSDCDKLLWDKKERANIDEFCNHL